MSNRVSELTSIIADSTTKINAYLTLHGHGALSFDADVPPSAQRDKDFTTPRDAALEACNELQALLKGSIGAIMNRCTPDIANMHAICHLNIATSFPKEKEMVTYTELAEASGNPEAEVRRFVRGAMTNYVFQEPRPGHVKHTAASRLIANNPYVRQTIGMFAEDMMPASLKVVNAIEKWPNSGEPNETGFAMMNNSTDTCWEYMAKIPGREQRFGDTMTLMSMGGGYGPEALLQYFADNDLTQGTLVDVGGSHGSFSIPLVQKFPKLRGIVQDQPKVVEVGTKHIPEDLKDRVEFMAHNFFAEQSIQANVYLLRWILHDWSDEYAIKILRALIPALRDGTRIIIHEYIVPEPGQSSQAAQISLRLFDLYMRGLCNGKEREAQDWKALFVKADSRFHIRAFAQSPMSRLGIIDVEWKSG